MKIYHLSHTDLDGYGAQFVTKHYFKDILFFNSNYGREIEVKFEEILNLIENSAKVNENSEKIYEKSIVLITDLNLNLQQCEKFENALKDKNSVIFLLDHHQTGLECSKKFPWYLMDSSRCATLITYDFFSKMYGKDDKLFKFVNVVNAVDIWIKDNHWFEMGKVCMGVVSGAKEINKIMFDENSREYIFYLLDKSYLDKKGILTYNIGNTSIIGNDFLVQNPDIDFFIDVTSKKTLSFRANGNADVSQMAKDLVGGGGHVNASGGFYAGFKDGYNYQSIKDQITDLISKKTSLA